MRARTVPGNGKGIDQFIVFLHSVGSHTACEAFDVQAHLLGQATRSGELACEDAADLRLARTKISCYLSLGNALLPARASCPFQSSLKVDY